MSNRQTSLCETLLLGGICGFFFFFRLSGFGLTGPDEPRYAQVAREMLARGDWVTPFLYHHTWLEKPILLYWGEMLSYSVFGVSDWAARIPSAVAATLLVLGTFLAVRVSRRPARLDAALMVASSTLILGFGRAAATDILLASPWCLSLLAWFCWYQTHHETTPGVSPASAAPLLPSSGRSRKLYLYLFYAFNAVAMLAKGPVAPVLAAAVLILFCASQRNPRALLRTLDPAGVVLFLAIAAPWYILVQLRTPEFFRVFFLQHNLARFGSNLYRHRQPFWFYLPVALAATIPWTVWVLHGLRDAIAGLRAEGAPLNFSFGEWGFRSRKQTTPLKQRKLEWGTSQTTKEPDNAAPSFTFEIFLLIWALVPIVFFSLSHSKLPGYILPSIPALLILAAVAVHRRDARRERPRRLSTAAHAILMAALASAACLAPQLAFKLPLSHSRLMLAALAGTFVFLLTALPILYGGWRYLHFVTLLPVILIVGYILRDLAPAVDATQSARPVAGLLQQVGQQPGSLAGLPVATFGLRRTTAFGLAFYLNRRVDPYEGLEISPAVYELPAAVPSQAHLLVAREGELSALRLLLAGRSLLYLGSYTPQHMEIFQVSAASISAEPDPAAPGSTPALP
jgi:4-amino-4-deoxy-L-arabinose transferase-like glycosyltransferase